MKVKYLVILVFLIPSCFGGGIDKAGSVKTYRNGIVTTEGGRFRIGVLPADWKRTRFSYRAILWDHQERQASITVDAFCQGSFDDAPLSVLTNQLVYNLTDQERKMTRSFELDGREALRTVVQGKLDGAPVVLDVVVLKMNECVFDFSHVAKPDDYSAGTKDFEGLYEGFKYLVGP